MGLCRLEGVVGGFTGIRRGVGDVNEGKVEVVESTTETTPKESEGGNWPVTTPCAVIERASCPDQRVIRSTLEYIVRAVDEEGSRPPGLLVVGAVCEALYTPKRGCQWVVEEGYTGLDGLNSFGEDGIGDEGLRVVREMEMAIEGAKMEGS